MCVCFRETYDVDLKNILYRRTRAELASGSMVFIHERFDFSQFMDEMLPLDDDQRNCKAIVDRVFTDFVFPKFGKSFENEVHVSDREMHCNMDRDIMAFKRMSAYNSFIMALTCYGRLDQREYIIMAYLCCCYVLDPIQASKVVKGFTGLVRSSMCN